jgi:aspartate carbamoyltransferase catalytic subunit
MSFKRKDLLGIKDLSAEEIEYILDTAKTMKMILTSNNKRTPHLQGKSIVTLFYENSTRTRLSFELASKYMGASSANISSNTSSVQKGESLIDTARTIDRMGTDIIIMRHPMSGSAALMAKNVKASVINAGDGMNEHPTQALLDLFTIREIKGNLTGLKVAIIGDIYHSRVARSNIWGVTKLGAEVSVAGPATLLPPLMEKMKVKVYSTIQEALIDADVIIVLRIQKERQKNGLFPTVREYARFFGLDEKRMLLAKDDAIILHPGPVNRGIELTTSVIEGKQAFIDEQVTNGVAIRMALLYLLTRRSEQDEAFD